MNVQQALIRGRQYLRENGIESADLDARVLLSKVTGLDRTGIILGGELELCSGQEESYGALLGRRAKGEPVAYLIGIKEFMGLDFIVSSAVLIPRPETELLVERAVELLMGDDIHSLVVDVGTGSGAIAVSLSKLIPDLQIHSVDISSAALEVAAQNAELHKVGQRVTFHLGNLLEPIPQDLNGKVGLITANLPYIPTQEINELMPDVRNYEPHLALDGGPDGLDLYRQLLPRAATLLQPGGHLLMEIGPGQGEATLALLQPEQWTGALYHDLANRERLVVATKHH